MKRLLVAPIFAFAFLNSRVMSGSADPIAKVIELIDTLSVKLDEDASKEEKAYHAYYDWCQDSAHQKMFEIKSSTTQKEKLESAIGKAVTDADACRARIDELASDIKEDEKDVATADKIREDEKEEFDTSEAELVSAEDTLNRAIQVLEKEMAKNPAAFAQLQQQVNAEGLASALSAVLDAAAFLNRDKARLLDLVQSQQEDSADDGSSASAPAPAVYKSHSAGIVDTLEELKEDATTQLRALRKTEAANAGNHKLLVTGLKHKIAADEKSLADQKILLADASEMKAASEKELVLTVKSIEDTKAALKSVREGCMRTAADHEQSIQSRDEELKALGDAKKVLQDTTGGAVQATYAFLQLGTSTNLVKSQSTPTPAPAPAEERRKEQIASFVSELAKEHRSAALAQLASKISAITRFGAAAGEDPFAKVKGLISDMIERLEREAKKDAEEKAYCDAEMSHTEAKKESLEDEKEKLTAAIDTAVALSASLKKQVRELQVEMAQLASERTGIDKVRAQESEAYKSVKADLEQGILGIRKAIQILRKYYSNTDGQDDSLLQQDQGQPAKPVSHKPSEGPGGNILAILEVAESDMAKNLASIETEESDAQSAYDTRVQEIKTSFALKGGDIKYKVQEFKTADSEVSRDSEARDAAEEELSAVLDYYSKVKEKCIAKPETFEERMARRKAEIDGLQEALGILEEETAPQFVQVQSRHRHHVQRGFLRSSV